MQDKIMVYEGVPPSSKELYLKKPYGYFKETEYTRSDITTELADALEGLMEGNEFDSNGQWGRIVIPSGIALNKAKAALKKVWR